jgi:hypothetical protein
MFQCAILTCAMVFFQGSRERDGLREQLRPHPGSDDVSWARPAKKEKPTQIKGPIWTRGVAMHREADTSVWITPGPSGMGDSFGLGVTVDF